MENLKNNFDILLNKVNKIASLKLENDEKNVMQTMLKGGIGASANPAITKLSIALGTKETNNFRVNEPSSSFMSADYSSADFNKVNQDIEAILESGYNAKIIDQNINLANMLNGRPTKDSKGEVMLHLTSKLHMNDSKEQPISYCDFEAKYETILAFMSTVESNNMRLGPSNKLYLYNTIINLLNDLETNKVNFNSTILKNNMTELSKSIPNQNLLNYMDKIGIADLAKIHSVMNTKKNTLNDARKKLEQQLFNNVESDFDMSKCQKSFASAVHDIQKRKKMCDFDIEEQELSF